MALLNPPPATAITATNPASDGALEHSELATA
jgi:hypothetical protein